MRRRWSAPNDDLGLPGDRGFTLVEAMVGLLLVTVGMLALLTEVTAYIRTQGAEKSQAQAVRKLSSTVEDARALSAQGLAATVGTFSKTTATPSGNYTVTTDLKLCSLNDSASQCTTPASAATTDRRLVATVAWTYDGKQHTLSTSTSIADRDDSTYRAAGTGALGGLLGGVDRPSTLVTVQSMNANPSPITISATGVPTTAVNVALTTLGLTSATTTIPVTWTDDTGSHQAALTGGPSSWNVSIPAGTITKAPPSGQVSTTLTFAAAVPGAQGLTTASVTLTAKPTFASCSITPSPIRLGLLSGKTTTAETLTCTTAGLRTTDLVQVTYTSGLGTATAALTSNDGATWTKVLPSGTALGPLGLLTTFTFNASRDGVTATPVVISSVLGT